MWRAVSQPSLSIGPTPFTPDGDGRDDKLLISLLLPAETTVRLSIIGANGMTLYTFPTIAEKQYWTGNTSSGHPAPIGPFYVIAEYIKNGNKSIIRNRGVLWR
jgi:hypothetical protein